MENVFLKTNVCNGKSCWDSTYHFREDKTQPNMDMDMDFLEALASLMTVFNHSKQCKCCPFLCLPCLGSTSSTHLLGLFLSHFHLNVTSACAIKVTNPSASSLKPSLSSNYPSTVDLRLPNLPNVFMLLIFSCSRKTHQWVETFTLRKR